MTNRQGQNILRTRKCGGDYRVSGAPGEPLKEGETDCWTDLQLQSPFISFYLQLHLQDLLTAGPAFHIRSRMPLTSRGRRIILTSL